MTQPTLELQLAEVRPNGFACILADPAWPEHGGGGRGAQNHYPLMSVEDIVSLPVAASLAAPNAHCWMWVTNNYLPDGIRALQTWGFRYVSNVAWIKGRIGNDGRLVQHMGLGQYLRGAHELLLFGVRGTLPARRAVPSAFVADRRRHSAKPAESYALIEAVSPGPRIELFCREARFGWAALGHETSGGDLHAQLRELRQVPGALSRLVAA